jgi:hypothetical protein
VFAGNPAEMEELQVSSQKLEVGKLVDWWKYLPSEYHVLRGCITEVTPRRTIKCKFCISGEEAEFDCLTFEHVGGCGRIRYVGPWPYADATCTSSCKHDLLKIPSMPTGDVNDSKGAFELPGRPNLEAFFNDYIIDIVQNMERYKAFGIEFPSAIVLHGPPGCGKTFAVERLVEYLGWFCIQVDSSSVGSPYIHETSMKVAKIFDKAIENAPSVLIIDEMEAFLPDRGMGSGPHRVEEVAEFLRRIPEASKNRVLVIGMTNRLDLIDTAILRRGRFDHHIKVDYPGEEEVRSLLNNLLCTITKGEDVDTSQLAKHLAGRPLSDVAFVVRESARLAVKYNKPKLDQETLLAATKLAPAREREDGSKARIGFT